MKQDRRVEQGTTTRYGAPIFFWTASLAVAGCNVDAPPLSTGGVQLEEPQTSLPGAPRGDADASPTPDGSPPKACERGLAIVATDFTSTNIAIAKLDGTPVSPSFISSGATAPGLGLAVGGDVDVPPEAQPSKRVVLIDRAGTNLITWLDLESARVLGQLDVGQGFESNPQDYLEIDERTAWVTRFEKNPTPGERDFDTGNDVLIIDSRTGGDTKPAIVGHIPMPEEDPSLLPRADGLTRFGGDIIVSLQRISEDFLKGGDGRFVGISPKANAIVWTVDIAGLSDCGRVQASPAGSLLAVPCTGRPTSGGNELTSSDVVVFDGRTTPPRELRRLNLAASLGANIQWDALAFATEEVIVGKTFGSGSKGDAAFAVNVTTGERIPLFESAEAYSLGGVHCSPGCGDVCVLTDADQNVLHRWHVVAGGAMPSFERLSDVSIDPDNVVGLPPRSVGGL